MARPTDPPDAEGYAALAVVAHGINRTELDRRWPEPEPDTDGLDVDVYRIVRAEWFRLHPDESRGSAWAAYKLKIVQEYEDAEPGARGEVLRRESPYSSHLTEWRKARDVGALAGLAATRGRPPADPVERDNQQLRELNTRLEADLDTARRVIEVQGKVSALLEDLS